MDDLKSIYDCMVDISHKIENLSTTDIDVAKALDILYECVGLVYDLVEEKLST